MEHAKLYYLKYFLDSYWHQLGDEVYASVGNAATAFLAESSVYQIGLIRDLDAASTRHLLSDDFEDPVYDLPFWSQFDRVITKNDAKIIRSILEAGMVR